MKKMQILSLQNPLVKHLVKIRQDKAYRNAQRSVILEGIRPIIEVAQSVQIKRLLTVDPDIVPPHLKPAELVIVNQSIIEKISGLQHSPGILAEMEMPLPANLSAVKFLLVIDQLNDPGNLGSIMRSALAFGWDGMFILNQSCDIFNDKCLRAARGATFKLPYAFGNLQTLMQIIEKNQLKILVADVEGTSIAALGPQPNAALVLSHESGGAASGSFTKAQKITIPMPGNMESLNVAIAGSILLYSLKG